MAAGFARATTQLEKGRGDIIHYQCHLMPCDISGGGTPLNMLLLQLPGGNVSFSCHYYYTLNLVVNEIHRRKP